MRKLLFLILIFPVFLTYGQKSSKLIGTWSLDKKEPKPDKSLMIIPISDKKEEPKSEKGEIILQFYENGKLDYKQGPQQYRDTYKLKDTVLTIGTRNYYIIKLSDSELVVKEDMDLFPKTFFYVKSEIKLEPTKEFEEFVHTYENGKIKQKSQYRYGYPNGEWIEYYESGQIKSKKYFKDGISVGKWKFYDETGKLTKEIAN